VPGKFRNPYWLMELELLGGNKVKVKLTNQLTRPQSLDVYFRAQFQPGGPMVELGPFSAEPRSPAGTPKASHEQELTLTGAYAPKGVYAVRQVLTWETAAVKRIDQIAIGTAGGDEWALPHRLAHKKLVSFLKKEEEKKEEPAAAVAGSDSGAGTPMGSGSMKPGGLGGMEQMAVPRTKNGLVAERYLEKTEQARRVPVALALIVDQLHVSRVQTAFANSPMRFLTTQVILHRYPNSVRPPETLQVAGGKEGDPGDPMSGAVPGPTGGFPAYYPGGKMGSGSYFQPSRSSAMPYPMGGTDAGGTGYPGYPGMTGYPGSGLPSAGGDEGETNMELGLYGIVSIYERFPPRRTPAPGAATTTTSQ
jgi:hypothetical protein